MDEPNWIFYQSINVSIKRSQIYHHNTNSNFIFDYIGSNLSKMDEIEFLTKQKILLEKVLKTFPMTIKMAIYFQLF